MPRSDAKVVSLSPRLWECAHCFNVWCLVVVVAAVGQFINRKRWREEGRVRRSERWARYKMRNVSLNARHLRRCRRGVVCNCHIFGMLQVSSSTESRADRRYRQDSSNTPASMITVGDSCHTQAPLASLANVRILYATQNHVMCVSYCRYAAQFRSTRRRPVT